MSVGGLFGSSTDSSAASNILGASQGAFGANEGFLTPFQNAGSSILGTISNLLSGGSSTLSQSLNSNPYDVNTIGAGYQGSPGFNFQVGQAQNALSNSSAAKGQLLSGNQVQGAENVATNLANQNYNQYVTQQQNGISQNFNNASSMLGNMLGFSGQGLTAGSNLLSGGVGAVTGVSGAYGNLMGQAGAQQASGINGLTSGLGRLFGMAG